MFPFYPVSDYRSLPMQQPLQPFFPQTFNPYLSYEQKPATWDRRLPFETPFFPATPFANFNQQPWLAYPSMFNNPLPPNVPGFQTIPQLPNFYPQQQQYLQQPYMPQQPYLPQQPYMPQQNMPMLHNLHRQYLAFAGQLPVGY